jgi:epoxyqueuosine reductase
VNLRDEIIEFAKSLDIDAVGFADVSLYRRIADAAVPGELLSSAKIAIVYLLTFEKLEQKHGRWYVVSLNKHISTTNKHLAGFLQERGYEARGVQEAEYSHKTLVGKISFRQMAVLAGLGSIGKNQMLLHHHFGPEVVIGVLLTNADVPPDSPGTSELCIECDVCITACPVNAFEESYDRWRCKNRRNILKKGCGTPCVAACPIGER